ncbi:MAG: SDR family oxidoreductase [Novosphingobium sp.]|nr:SDR family oxidoreductase [Novosphingobium sp.]
MELALAGKTALVTGGSSGMGKFAAGLLAMDGARVVIVGRRQEVLDAALEDLRRQVPEGQIEAFRGDASDGDSVRAMLAYAHGLADRLDIIVNSVGGGAYKPLLMFDEDEVMAEYRITALSAFLLARYGVPLMGAGGSIVCVSSTAGFRSCMGLGPYNMAKAALEMFVKVAAEEFGSAGIRVNAVRPGMTRAEGTADMFVDDALVKTFTDIIPLGRVGESEDLAKVIRFLAGPESGWVTGQVFAADGGQELKGFPDPNPMLDMIYGEDAMAQVRAGKSPVD